MADLDTAFKRASGILVGIPWRAPGKYPPAATFTSSERQAAAYFYGGIAPSTVVVAELIGRKRARIRGRSRRYSPEEIPQVLKKIVLEKDLIAEELAAVTTEVALTKVSVDNAVNRTAKLKILAKKVSDLEIQMAVADEEAEFLLLVVYAVQEIM